MADRFQQIELGDENLGGSSFDASITIRTPLVAGNLDYRVYEQGKPPSEKSNPWKPAAAQDGMQVVKLTTPRSHTGGAICIL